MYSRSRHSEGAGSEADEVLNGTSYAKQLTTLGT